MKRIIICTLFILIVILSFLLLNKNKPSEKTKKMIDLSNYTIDELKQFASDNSLNLKINEIYSNDFPINSIINQSIMEGEEYTDNYDLTVDLVIGTLEDKINQQIKVYVDNNVNELGRVPIMMYHGIHHKSNSDTDYIGGNIDKDGYQRTSEAFRNDLEFYYQNNYRMIRLTDYVDGIIDVELGKSPIILTFDDGLQNNINVIGVDENGEIIIDPNCAVGILEEFKKKYPDYNVTATFFVNYELFNQPEYNEKILKWLVENDYDIGNHTATHADFTKIDINKINYQIGSVYELLGNIIPNQYVNIVALPYGSPYKKSHANFQNILNSNYNGNNYNTKSALRVGWESDYSPFSINFDPTFLKRIRAYDNNGEEFDIEMNFKMLEKNRYISDGDKNKIVVKESDLSSINNTFNLEIITY
ncbi:MAG: polysaccharide deacetylase family protein [Bacilli bacterium]|nr:polysaccharide deacetylase family protein [Bacilli bacterium]